MADYQMYDGQCCQFSVKDEDTVRLPNFYAQTKLQPVMTHISSYPPTLEHLLLILSLVRPITRTPNPSYKSTVLPEVPCLVVLHEPSRYFQSSPDKDLCVFSRQAQKAMLDTIIPAHSLSTCIS